MPAFSRPHPLASDDGFQRMIEAIGDYAIYMLDSTGHVVSWNRGAELNKGYTSGEILGKHFRVFFTPEDRLAGAAERELAIAQEAGRFSGEGWRLHKSGARYWASAVLTPLRSPQGELLGFAKVLRDLTARKKQEDALLAMDAALRVERDQLQEERDRFLAAAESSLDSFFICKAVRDQAGEIEDFVFTYLNRNVEEIVSVPRCEMLGRRMCDVLPLHRSSGLLEHYKDVVRTGEPLILELPIDDGKVKSTWIRVQAVKLRDGIAVTASDITRRKSDEAQILHMARHDALTGLLNRSVLADRVDQAIRDAERRRQHMAVLLIDLDNFKQINDSLGHLAGDHVLRTIAARLTSLLRKSDSVIRIGGDEFVIVIPELPLKEDLQQLGRKILMHIAEPVTIAGNPLQISCSLGTAVYPNDARTPEALISHADKVMYAAKRFETNRRSLFGRSTPPSPQAAYPRPGAGPSGLSI